jgi:hypothetical protein
VELHTIISMVFIEYNKRGIPLIQVAPIYSFFGYGRLPQNADGT